MVTEPERIISSGRIPEDFLAPEIRNEFFVDTTRKKLWAISLDLLLEFDSVCKKHNLNYFLAFGTLLGAVRHHGFIPWDDDVDVYMLREDYEKFLLCDKEFKDPYFFETPYTDPGYFYSSARIRNSNTTAIVDTFRYQGFNQGVWLTIFPIDNWMLERGDDNYERIKTLLKENSTYMRLTNPTLDEYHYERVRNYSGRDPFDTYEEIHRIASQYRTKDTDKVAMIVNTVYPYHKLVYNKSDFSETVYVNFENVKLPIPSGYQNILKTLYGDYMSFPPIEQRGNWHTGMFIDPDKPYKYYIDKDQSIRK